MAIVILGASATEQEVELQSRATNLPPGGKLRYRVHGDALHDVLTPPGRILCASVTFP